MKKLNELLKMVESNASSFEKDMIGLENCSLKHLVGLGGYNQANGSCISTQSSYNNSCVPPSNRSCHSNESGA